MGEKIREHSLSLYIYIYYYSFMGVSTGSNGKTLKKPVKQWLPDCIYFISFVDHLSVQTRYVAESTQNREEWAQQIRLATLKSGAVVHALYY